MSDTVKADQETSDRTATLSNGAGSSDCISQPGAMDSSQYLDAEASPNDSSDCLSPQSTARFALQAGRDQRELSSKSGILPQCSPRPGAKVEERNFPSVNQSNGSLERRPTFFDSFDYVDETSAVADISEASPIFHEGPNKRLKTSEYASPNPSYEEKNAYQQGSSLLANGPPPGHGVRSPEHSMQFFSIFGPQVSTETTHSRDNAAFKVPEPNASGGVFDDADDDFLAKQVPALQQKGIEQVRGDKIGYAMPEVSSMASRACPDPLKLGQQASVHISPSLAIPLSNGGSAGRSTSSFDTYSGFGSLAVGTAASLHPIPNQENSNTDVQQVEDPYVDDESSDGTSNAVASSSFGQIAASSISRNLLHIAPREHNAEELDAAAPRSSDFDRESQKSSKPETKKKGKVLPTPGVTTSAKDFKFAKTCLTGVTDLSLVLAEDDCRFLGENFWVFSLQQLEYVLDIGDTTDRDPASTPSEDIRHEILQAMATRSLDGLEPGAHHLSSDKNALNSVSSCFDKPQVEKNPTYPEMITVDSRLEPSNSSDEKMTDRTVFKDVTSALPGCSSTAPSYSAESRSTSSKIPRHVSDDNHRVSEEAISLSVPDIPGQSTTLPPDEAGRSSPSPKILRPVTDANDADIMDEISLSGKHDNAVPSAGCTERATPDSIVSPVELEAVSFLEDVEKSPSLVRMSPTVSRSDVGSETDKPSREEGHTDGGEGFSDGTNRASAPLLESEASPNQSSKGSAKEGKDGPASVEDETGATCPPSKQLDQSHRLAGPGTTEDKTVGGSQLAGISRVPKKSTADSPKEESKAVRKKALEEAEARIGNWIDTINKWKENERGSECREILDSSPHHVENQFPLDGPVSCLLPLLFRNFLASVSIKTVFRFFSSKKTESSGAVYAFQLWRKTCDLPFVKASTLARNFQGLSSRLKVAITSVPPADPYTRKWLGGELMVLTGSGKEYLIDYCHFDSADELVNSRTKDVSDTLVRWREQRGFPALKGSGKVAMVSAWKTALKETKEAEIGEGRVLPECDFLRNDILILPPRTEKAKKRPKRQTDALDEKELEGIRKSPEFLSGLLKPEVVSFLASQGIETAEQLLKSPQRLSTGVDEALLEFHSRHVPNDGSTHTHIWGQWISIVESRLKGILQQKRKTKEESKKSMPNTGVTGGRSNTPPIRVAKQTNSQRGNQVSAKDPLKRRDPFQALSDTSRRFLESEGITTCQAFLDARTTDLANAFVRWRAKVKMPALKGQGSIASISGWKGVVRKLMTEKNGTTFATPASKKQHLPEVRPRLEIEPMTHDDVLMGLPYRDITVKNKQGVLFDFELSVRQSKSTSAGIGVFITYKGSRQHDVPQSVASKSNWYSLGFQNNETSPNEKSVSQSSFQVLLDVPISGQRHDMAHVLSPAECFAFSSRGAGCGLLELGAYGVRPFQSCARGDDLKQRIKQFVRCEIYSPKIEGDAKIMPNLKTDLGVPGGNTSANVFTVERGYNVQDLLFIEHPMEKGQTVELKYHDENQSGYGGDSSMHSRGIGCDVRFRIALANELACLSLVELHRLYIFTVQTIAGPILADLSKITHDIFDQSLRKINEEEIIGFPYDVETKKLLLVSRRRLHWVASAIRKQTCDFLSISQSSSRAKRLHAMKKGLDSLQWDVGVTSTLGMIVESCNDALIPVINEEVANEILVDLIQHKKLRCPFDDAAWCPLSLRLLRQSLLTVSSYVLTGSDSDKNLLTKQQSVVDELVMCVSDATENLLSPQRNLQDLTFSREMISSRCVLPDGASLAERESSFCSAGSGIQAYTDAMNLCDEHTVATETFCDPAMLASTDSLLVSEAPWKVDSSSQSSQRGVVLRPKSDVDASIATLHVSWYLEYQVLPVVHAVASSNLIAWASMPVAFEPNTCIYKIDHLVSAVNAIMKTDDTEPFQLAGGKVATGGFTDVVRLRALESPHPPQSLAFAPTPDQLFLGVVWPILHRSYGWQLGAGDSPEDIVFFPPGHKNHDRLSSGQKAVARQQERKRKAIVHNSNIETIGWGHLSKTMKTVFADAVESWKEGSAASRQGFLAKDALSQFVKAVSDDLPPSLENSDLLRIQRIADAVLNCMIELSPVLVGSFETTDRDQIDKRISCEDLLRFLVLVPDMLTVKGIDAKKRDDVTAVIHELVQFLAFNSYKFFAEDSNEETPHVPFISSRVLNLAGRESKNEATLEGESGIEVYDELIRPSDHPLLTDFISTVISQMLAYRATEQDVLKKGRRALRVGTPGLICRHCKGSEGEGAYFFSSLDSFGTASTVVHAHLKRCSKCPQHIKDLAKVLKATHGDQRKALKHGSQTEFFARLWARLMALPSNTSFTVRDQIVEPPSLQRRSSILNTPDQDDTPLKFHNHLDLICHLVQNETWIERKDIKQCLQQYYRCLEEGGRIFMTSAMPSHFNSEWLLATMVPRQAHAKTHFLSSG